MRPDLPPGAKKRAGGPKTAGGKVRSSRNAVRHGLTTISRHNRAFAPNIVEIAKAMCSDDQDPLLYDKALLVAECDVLLAQVRTYRMALIERLIELKSLPTTKRRTEWKNTRDFVHLQHKLYDEIMAVHPPPGAPCKEGKFDRLLKIFFCWGQNRDDHTAFVAALPDIIRLARYKQRAWSRRSRAFREFLVIKSGRELS